MNEIIANYQEVYKAEYAEVFYSSFLTELLFSCKDPITMTSRDSKNFLSYYAGTKPIFFPALNTEVSGMRG